MTQIGMGCGVAGSDFQKDRPQCENCYHWKHEADNWGKCEWGKQGRLPYWAVRVGGMNTGHSMGKGCEAWTPRP